MSNPIVPIIVIALTVIALNSLIPADLGGFAIISLDNVQLVSNSPDLNGKTVWMATATVSGSDRIAGKIREGKLKFGNKVNEKNIEFKTESFSEWFEYSLDESKNSLWDYSVVRPRYIWQGCPAGTIYQTEKSSGIFRYKLCVIKNKAEWEYQRIRLMGGTVGSSYNFEAKIRVLIDGQEDAVGTLTKSGDKSVILKDKYGNTRARIQYLGSLDEGQAPDLANNYILAKDYDTGLYFVVPDKIDESLNEVKSCLEKSSYDTIDQLIAECSLKDDYIRANMLDKAIKSSDIEVQGNLLKVIPQITVFKPVFRFWIDAEWVGIKMMVTRPEIIDAPSIIEFTAGQGKVIDVKVKNNGEEGRVDVNLQCNSNKISYIGDELFIGKNSIANAKIFVNGEQGTYSCKIIAEDFTDPTIEDISSLSLKVKAGYCDRDDDGDGISNCQDACPLEKGDEENNGCKERAEPSPPSIPGVGSGNDGKNGCPWWNIPCKVALGIADILTRIIGSAVIMSISLGLIILISGLPYFNKFNFIQITRTFILYNWLTLLLVGTGILSIFFTATALKGAIILANLTGGV